MKPIVQILPLKSAVSQNPTGKFPVLIRLLAPELPQEVGVRPPLNISFVIDRSGSMSGIIENAKRAVIHALGQLLPTDTVSVVIYDDDVEVLIPATLAVDVSAMQRIVSGITVGGSTNLFGGWHQGATQVASRLDPRALNRVILLSDGQANHGETRLSEISRHVAELARNGVSTTTMGLGAGFNEDLMVAMGQAGEGNFYFIESAEQIEPIFAHELNGMLTTQASRVRLRLEGDRLKYELLNRYSLNKYHQYRLPNLVAGRTTDLLFQFEVQPDQGLKAVLRLSWDDRSGERRRDYILLELPAVAEEVYQALPEDPQVAAMVLRFEAIQAREEATRRLDLGDLTGAREVLLMSRSFMVGREEYLGRDIAEMLRLETEMELDPNRARKRAYDQAYRDRRGRHDS